jgi:DnaJ-class molecular chaperone
MSDRVLTGVMIGVATLMIIGIPFLFRRKRETEYANYNYSAKAEAFRERRDKKRRANHQTKKISQARKTLGVKESATKANITKAFRQLSRKHHPDKGGSSNKAQEITEAYQTLTNQGDHINYID